MIAMKLRNMVSIATGTVFGDPQFILLKMFLTAGILSTVIWCPSLVQRSSPTAPGAPTSQASQAVGP